MKRLIFAAVLAALFVTGATARPTPGQEQQLTPAEMKALKDLAQKALAPPVKVAPPAVADPTPAPSPAAAPAIPTPAPTVTPPVTQNTVTTTGPVSSETTISIGTLAGQALNWILTIAAVPISGYAVLILNRVLGNLKIPMTDAARARLKEMIVNGINLAAPAVQAQLAGQGNIAIKNEVAQRTIAYVQAHGAETIKKLGLDPSTPAGQEAIRAWIETAIVDPETPTAPALDPAKPAVAPAAAVAAPPPQPAKA